MDLVIVQALGMKLFLYLKGLEIHSVKIIHQKRGLTLVAFLSLLCFIVYMWLSGATSTGF